MKNSSLRDIYRRLFERYGEQHWWPGETPFEMMAGAILTQSTSWKNVEKAVANLKCHNLLSPRGIRQVPLPELASLIRSSGYFNVKAVKLKEMAGWLEQSCGDNPTLLTNIETKTLRQQLLAVYGIGPETADSILLYAVGKPVFVIDAYTVRILNRLGLVPGNIGYEQCQSFVMERLPPDAVLFNEFHALLVCLGKNVCRRQPLCRECCLFDISRHGQAN